MKENKNIIAKIKAADLRGRGISKLKAANLKGRGGADFPTYLKWQMFADQKADKKYIVANGSEGEPNVLKDGYILQKNPSQLIEGLKIALETFPGSEAFLYLRHDYYKKHKNNLEKIIGDLPITVFKEKGGYLSGEETVVCQEIEKKIARPRSKPPYPVQVGIDGKPTLINNIETIYYVPEIAKGTYKHSRLYSITGKVKNKGVFELPVDMSIKEILKQTNNFPKFDYFVQVGGGASGDVLLDSETDQLVVGSGAIIVYDKTNTDPWVLMRGWIDFFMKENCDKCTPCREGTYRILEMIKERKFDKEVLEDLFFVLENTSFCALGKSVPLPFRSAIKKLL